MLTLDDETYELLGYGSERGSYEQDMHLIRRRLQLRAAWLRYSRSAKGKAAKKRYSETLKRKEKKTGYSLSYYRKNPEKERARARAYQQRMKADPEYRRKAAAKALAYYHRKKKLKKGKS